MAKMIKTAQGDVIDWDLLKIQSQVNNNVAEPVEVVDHAAIAARRQQRARMEAARNLLAVAQAEATGVDTTTPESPKQLSTKRGKNA
jgi:anaerobic ribonucleoside-triphosphate reductase